MESDFEVQLVVLYKLCYLYINQFDITHFFCLEISQNGLTYCTCSIQTHLDCYPLSKLLLWIVCLKIEEFPILIQKLVKMVQVWYMHQIIIYCKEHFPGIESKFLTFFSVGRVSFLVILSTPDYYCVFKEMENISIS